MKSLNVLDMKRLLFLFAMLLTPFALMAQEVIPSEGSITILSKAPLFKEGIVSYFIYSFDFQCIL